MSLCQLSILPEDLLSASEHYRLKMITKIKKKTRTNPRQALLQGTQATWTLRPRTHQEPAL